MSNARLQVIDDEDYERVQDRVAAVDVAKVSRMVYACAPSSPAPGAASSEW